MSHPEHEVESAALGRLRDAVERLMAQHGVERDRAERAEKQLRELEQLLKAFEVGTESPKGLRDRVDALEAERADLLDRLERGRETVQRALGRIRFLEERA